MELMEKKDYKDTEYGLIPNDWKLGSIGELCTIFGRIGFRGYTVNDIVKEDQGAITLSPSNIIDGKLNLSKVTYLSWFKYEESPEIKIYNGDILLVKTGSTFGKTALVQNLNQKATLNPQIVVLKKVKCNNAFLGYMMGYPIVQNQINSTVVGGAIPTLSQEQVSRFKIPLPPTLEEQKAIATALSDVDALITSLDKLITKKKAIKQGAMQQLLTPPQKGGKRLEGFNGEWERIKIEKVITVARGGSPRPIQDYLTTFSNGINWIKIGDTSPKSKYITSSVEKIIPEGANHSRKVNSGDFLLSNSMSFGRPYILKIDGCIHDGWLVLQNYQDSFDTEFLYYTLMSKDVFDQYLMKASGSSVLNLNKEIVKTVELNRPTDLNEQKAIAEILSDMDKDIEQLETKKSKYAAIKHGMMQELLTGKTRLV